MKKKERLEWKFERSDFTAFESMKVSIVHIDRQIPIHVAIRVATQKAIAVTAGLLHDGSFLANQSVDSWSTGHSDQMEEKINVAHQHGMASAFRLLPRRIILRFDLKYQKLYSKLRHFSPISLSPLLSNLKYSIQHFSIPLIIKIN